MDCRTFSRPEGFARKAFREGSGWQAFRDSARFLSSSLQGEELNPEKCACQQRKEGTTTSSCSVSFEHDIKLINNWKFSQ